jgi:hypothetical protein
MAQAAMVPMAMRMVMEEEEANALLLLPHPEIL